MGYYILAFIIVAIWGVTFISTKVLIENGLTPAVIFTIRFIIAYAGIWLLDIFGSRKRKPRILSDSLKDEAMFLFLGLTGGSFYFLTENTALQFTQACNVSFLVCSTPLITAIMTILYKKFFNGRFADSLETVRLTPVFIAGTVLALAGMGMIVFNGARFEFSAKGDMLAIAAALCWGLYSLFTGEMTRVYGAVFTTRKVFFYGLLTIIPFLVGTDTDLSVLGRPAVWLNILFLGVVASLGCFALWSKVLEKIGNVTATNFVYLNPFFTLAAATVFLGEKMTPLSAAGSAAIFLGVFLAGKSRN